MNWYLHYIIEVLIILVCVPESLLLVIRRKLTSSLKCAVELCLTFTGQDTQ